VESLFAQMTLKQIVEALVFASPKPLSTKEIVAALKSAGNPEKTDDAAALDYARAKEGDVLPVLAEIQTELETTGRAFQLVEQVNGWSFVTIPSAVHWVRQLYPEAKPTRLTGPQLETLAIIAYRQPVTRADIEAVRGVAVDSVVQVLMERTLIKIAGRADVPGRPLLYETTEYFLQHFGLKAVTELPNADELRRIALPKAEHAESETSKERTKKAKHSGEEIKGEAVAKEDINAESAEPAPEVTAPASESTEHPS
jgi:segregation and condensation protein B